MDNPDPPDTRHRSRHFCTLGGADPRHSCKPDNHRGGDDEVSDDDHGDDHNEKEEDGEYVDSSYIGHPKLS